MGKREVMKPETSQPPVEGATRLHTLAASLGRCEAEKPDFEAYERKHIHARLDELIDSYAENIAQLGIDDAVEDILQKKNAALAAANAKANTRIASAAKWEARVRELRAELDEAEQRVSALEVSHDGLERQVRTAQNDLAFHRLHSRSFRYLIRTLGARIFEKMGLRKPPALTPPAPAE